MLNDIQLLDWPIKKGFDFLINISLVFTDLPDQGRKQFSINIAEILLLTKLGNDFTYIQTG